ncbi:hypothetical protein VTH8203_03513 [Vibrio thalassae]|uniref:Uncharacterized protein n=1 Tax=Vibrio thalassae TaxID=1243014 RepID=A0A240EPC9_9VIBR|nr:hypothetical protein [Vibrio thalassae]SNX49865.1 hypothetical protein VTH8203_03513 [Vibrio thalassae]
MKTIHIYHATYNYLSTPLEVASLRSSLMHNLRMQQRENEPHWNESFAHTNLVWLNHKVQPLDELSENERKALVEGLLPKSAARERKRWQKMRSAYKYKLKKAAVEERKYAKKHSNPAYIEAADILEMLWQVDSDCEIGTYWFNALERLTIRRKSQRLNAVSKFIQAHNQLVGEKPTQNVTHLQEGVIKVSSEWQVTHHDIAPYEWFNLVECFLTKHFPQYNIKLMVVHDDEREVDKQRCAHIHYYLDGQNSTFGQWDLVKSQIQVVNDYTREMNPQVNAPIYLLRDNCKLTREEMVVYGERYQCMFYDFFNKEFAHSKGLGAKRKPKKQTQPPKHKEAIKQAKQPEAQRDYQSGATHTSQMLARCMQLIEIILSSSKREHEQNETKYHQMLNETLEGIDDCAIRRIVTEACQLRLSGKNANLEWEKV